MKIISFKICPFVQRVTALLEAKGVDYDIEYIESGNKPQWFLDISPHGQVPVLITDGGEALFESDAIAEYVDETAGRVLSSGEAVKKAQDRAWSYLASKQYLVQCSAQRSADAETLKQRAVQLNEAFGKFEQQLPDSGFAGGKQPGMVDIAWLPLLHRAAIVEQKSGYDFVSEFPRLKRLQKDLMKTGIAEKSVSRDFNDKFATFYLTDDTYLGRVAAGYAAEPGYEDIAMNAADTCC